MEKHRQGDSECQQDFSLYRQDFASYDLPHVLSVCPQLPKVVTMTLYEKTRQLLKARPATMTFASIESETGINESWLRMFNRGKIANPSVNTVQTLYEHLTNSKLKV